VRKRLSILICSLNARAALLARLRSVLDPQITEEVEVLVNVDDGQLSIGDKRNALLAAATGDYIAFVDDDDMVRTNYVATILEAAKQNPDCIGIEGIITFNGNLKQGRIFIHSLQYRSWFEKDGVYYRNPNHLSPVKRELALQVKFPSKNHGEDHDYSIALLPFLKTEVYIKGPIYHYDYRENK
jgi:glycosyltransferase involved in cell wall biosynthesis